MQHPHKNTLFPKVCDNSTQLGREELLAGQMEGCVMKTVATQTVREDWVEQRKKEKK